MSNRQDTLPSFIEMDEAEIEIVDRSTLERYADCPHMARRIDSGECSSVGTLALAGSEGHHAIGQAMHDYFDQMDMSPGELADRLRAHLRAARPDVQAETLRAFGGNFAWEWANLVGQRHPDNILRFDGGEGRRSGQLARDLDCHPPLRITSEVDLLLATESKQLLREYDYKSGWKEFTTAGVRDSFQFQLHWWLISAQYPEVEALEMVVWQTRRGGWLYPVEFTRRDLPAIESRIRRTAGEYLRWRAVPVALVEAWPSADKCGYCPAAHVCPVADAIDATEPEKLLEQYAVTLQAADRRKAALWKARDARGADVESGGWRFGWDKPSKSSKPRKPTAPLYRIKGDDSEEEAE